jgi:hypothetical protein
MSDALARIEALEAKRAQINGDIDREIEGLKAQAMQELAEMRAKLSKLETVLKVPSPTIAPRVAAQAARSELDETDAGNGVREISDNVSAADFRDELAELRERTQAKRRRLG